MGRALVVNDHTIIGKGCTLRHSTTIGHKSTGAGGSDCPRIGDNVNIGPNCVILGAITIGDEVVIGAGSVVVKDVLSGVCSGGGESGGGFVGEE